MEWYFYTTTHYMIRISPLILFTAFLSIVSGYLISQATWVSKIGMDLFYKQYTFTQVWWQAALAVFAVLMFFLLVQLFVQKRMAHSTARTVHFILLFAALTGLFFTYNDFHHKFTHHITGENFHLGFYLFWIGWMVISLFYIVQKKPAKNEPDADAEPFI